MSIDLEGHLQNPDLQRRFANVKSRVIKEYLNFWQIHAPHFTDHGEPHCKTILMNIKEIISLDVLQDINEYESFMLLCSIWLHDIGIMGKKTKSETDEYIRQTHHERSRDMIMSDFNNLLDRQERIVIGNVCWAHSKKADINDLNDEKMIRHAELGNVKIREKFLASILRLSDALDICCTRTSESLEKIAYHSTESQFYHAIHDRVSGLIRNQTQVLIDINYMVKDEIEILNKYIVQPTQYELESVRSSLALNKVFLTDILPRYNKVNGLKALPKTPEENEIVEIPKDVKQKLDLKSAFLIKRREGESEEAKKIIDKLIKISDKDPAIWRLYGKYYSEFGDEDKAMKGLTEACRLEPTRQNYNSLGHYAGEYLYDIDASFEAFKTAYEIDPENELAILNYVEALITKGQSNDAYKLAMKVLNNTQLLRSTIYSLFFTICSNVISNNSIINSNEKTFLFVNIKRTTNIVNLPWVFEKFKYYIDESDILDDVKTLLFILIGFMSNEITNDEIDDLLMSLYDKQ